MNQPTLWWKYDSPSWFDVDGVDYISGLDPNGTWIITSLTPPMGQSLEARFTEQGFLLLRRREGSTIMATFAIPIDKVTWLAQYS